MTLSADATSYKENKIHTVNHRDAGSVLITHGSDLIQKLSGLL